MSLDKDITHYHAVAEQQTEYLFSKHFSENKIPTVDEPLENSQDLWFAGLERWGREWSDREYVLRAKNLSTLS